MATSLAMLRFWGTSAGCLSSGELNRCRPHECQDRRDVCSFFWSFQQCVQQKKTQTTHPHTHQHTHRHTHHRLTTFIPTHPLVPHPSDHFRRTAQNFALFFPSPATISFFLLSFGGPFVEFSGCRVHRHRDQHTPRHQHTPTHTHQHTPTHTHTNTHTPSSDRFHPKTIITTHPSGLSDRSHLPKHMG